MRRVFGLVNLHNSPRFRGLTDNRPVASTSFLGRYAFIDFALSNFANSGIDQIGVLVKDNLRSITKHLGSMKPWILNTKIGYGVIMYNENGLLNPPYNHDINNIRANDWILFEHNIDYVVIQPSHIIANVDFRPFIEEHIKNKEKISIVYTKISDADESFKNALTLDIKEGYVNSFGHNKGRSKEANVSLETYIINREVLRGIIDKAPTVNALYGLNEILPYIVTNKIYQIRALEYNGYVRCFDSLCHYMKYCGELLNDQELFNSLFDSNWTHYTVTHDTPPTLYGKNCDIKNSFVANGAVIKGRVENSIISRNVVINEGAVVKNSIIFTDTEVGEKAKLTNVVIDKHVSISHHVSLEGSVEAPIYVKQGEKI